MNQLIAHSISDSQTKLFGTGTGYRTSTGSFNIF
jgi:hypothetical protein